MRARRSSRSASGVSIVNGRIAVASAVISALTPIGSSLVVAVLARAGARSTPTRRPGVRAGKSSLTKGQGEATHPPYTPGASPPSGLRLGSSVSRTRRSSLGLARQPRGCQPGDNSGIETSAGPAARNPFRQAANLWWFWLIAGIFWVVVALVVLQFDGASITAVGVMIGFMFLLAGLQNLLFGAFDGGAARWILWIFGVLFLVA